MGNEGNSNISMNNEFKKIINERGHNLLYKLLPHKDYLQRNEKSFKTDTPSISIDSSQIKFIDSFKTKDLSGNTVERFFLVKNQYIGLNINDYKELHQLINLIYKNKELKNIVCKEYLEDVIFNWFELLYKGLASSELSEFLTNEMPKSIKEYFIGIPIAYTEIESPFTFGKVTFREFNKDIIDKSYNETIRIQGEQSTESLSLFFEEVRRKYQGKAIAIIQVVAEKKRAEEIAYKEVEQAISLLRFFHKASQNPLSVSYSTLSGMKEPISKSIFFFKNDFFTNHNTELVGTLDIWSISKDNINLYKQVGFDIISNLIKGKRNNFQNKLIDALMLFSKCSITDNFSDKLTAITVAAESIFIKDNNEPIQQNLADRIAFLVSDEPTERLKIVKIIKDTYKLRSKFLHHGKDVDEIDLFTSFLKIIWSSFFYMINLSQNIEIDTHEKFLSYIEHKKYS